MAEATSADGEFRRRIFEEVAASDLPGLIFTYVWAFDHQSDDAVVEEYAAIFRARGGHIVYVELECALAERLRRNETEFRLAMRRRRRTGSLTYDAAEDSSDRLRCIGHTCLPLNQGIRP